MNTCLRELFRDVAGCPREERERILAERRVPDQLQAEVESLLQYDSDSVDSLTERISGAALEALLWAEGPAVSHCGPYRLVRLLGSGGMGSVYLGERRDGEIEQKVAIKFLRSDADRPAWRDRFLRERQLLAYLNHASIARLLDAGHTHDARPYLVMEYVDGIAIDEYATSLDLSAKLRLFLLVCDGVAHAHRHKIVHRDLKPSNILVDASGHPKLLDFGIAKLLDAQTGETRTMERLLTPQYASPEQLRGDVQTTATDVYSLGAVLYTLLNGRSPREPLEHGNRDTTTSRLPRDIQCILRKALRFEPSDRYASVEAFADDIRAFLESRPVHARSAETWYRASKLLRSHRMAVVAVTITLTGLSVGLHAAKEQRGVAQTQLLHVRELVNKVLSLDEVADGLHGSTQTMRDIVGLAEQHLQAIAVDARKDKALALEMAEAYSFLARAQGICAASNAGQRAEARRSLRRATTLLEPVLAAEPDNRKVLLTAARIGHAQMVLAGNNRDADDAISEARQTAGHLDRLVKLGELSATESSTASEMFYDMALSSKNVGLLNEGIAYAKRSIAIAPKAHNAELRLTLAQSMLSDLLRLTGDLEGALLAIRQSRAHLERAQFASDGERRSTRSRVLGREGKILSLPGGVSLNQPDAAIVVQQKAFDLLEEWAQNDGGDSWSRLLFTTVAGELASNLRLRHPNKALAVYQHGLHRLREVKDNAEARRGEAELLAGSSYALRKLKRFNEAQERINDALRLLSGTGDYPARRVVPGEPADVALRALGDHLADVGKPERAAAVYEELLEKIVAARPDTENRLGAAASLSDIYASLTALHLRNGRPARAQALAAVRTEMWSTWNRKLQHNAFVVRQLEASHKN